ncbi:MAG: DUF386 domain-containing protein [Planctomycetia bacterium]|nr:DUF386 domain-containing protein [Planctomycetia bacterium]
MILDSLPRSHRYATLHPRFADAFAFLGRMPADIAVGRHEIAGDALFALVQRYETRPVDGMQLEAHRRYIDIQYLVAGSEVIRWAPLPGLDHATRPYDAEKDYALFALPPAATPLRIQAGEFMIFFPDDAHAPCGCLDLPAEVVKVVVKVEI